MDVLTLLIERKKEYGEAHELSGLVIGLLSEPFVKMVYSHPQLVHNWVLMLSKLIRILASPEKEDHYDDLIGYATLCKQILQKGVKHD